MTRMTPQTLYDIAEAEGGIYDAVGEGLITADDIRRSEAAIIELRQARRTNHREKVHWVDTLYKVYMTALVSGGAIAVGEGLITADDTDDSELQAAILKYEDARADLERIFDHFCKKHELDP